MAKIIDLPKLSPTMEEGTLVRWVKNEGDAVDIDDLLAEVETDKATMEFRAFDKGTLLKRLISEGTVATLGQPVAILGSPGEDITAVLSSVSATASSEATPPATPPAAQAAPVPVTPSVTATPAPAAPPVTAAPALAPAQTVVSVPSPASVVTAGGTAAPMVHGEQGVAGAILSPTSPRIRRIAREHDVDLGVVPGTGSHGRVMEQDLARGAVTAKTTVMAPGTPSLTPSLVVQPGTLGPRPDDTTRAPSPMRKTIARRITEAKQTVPHFYLEADLDVEALAALREQANLGAAPEDRVSFNDFFLRASALALRAVPESNVSWIDGQLVEHHRTDISMAVAIDDGLVTPVIRDVDSLSVRAIARQARELATRARARKLRPEEMSNGVFSVSNLGMFQIDRFAAVINPPEGMILAVGAVRDVPVVRAGQVVPGKRCAVTLSCDHRAVDGALGAKFLLALRGLIENPLRIVM